MNGAEIAPLLAAAARGDEAGFLGQGARLASAGGDAVAGWRGRRSGIIGLFFF